MPTSFKSAAKPKTASKAKKSTQESFVKRTARRQKERYAAFMSRRPHRSFQLTRRRDYVRPLALPGIFSFTNEVTRTLWRYKKMFGLLIAVYVVLYVLLVGMQSQETYTTLSDTLKETGGEVLKGGWGALGQAGLLLLSIGSSATGADMGEAQQIFSVLIFLLVWLTTVWLLRNLLAGHKVKLRDGLYNSGAPLFSTMIITLVIAIQLIPVGLAMIGYSAATGSGLISGGGAPAMLFWIGASLLGLLSLYWVTSSLFAMIIVTLPGMYPYQAIKTAGDIMLGRRVKILLRWLWLGLVSVVVWFVVLIPIVLLDMWLKSVWPAISWLPIVPAAIVIMAAATTVWLSAYVYLLYRKVVEYVPKS